MGDKKIFYDQVDCSMRLDRRSLCYGIETALKTKYYRIAYKDKYGKQKNSVRQGTFPETACTKYPHLYYGDMAFDMTSSATLELMTCDTSGNYYNTTISVE